METMLAYDLGTGGNKASIYDADGRLLASVFVPYSTTYPQTGWHEQRPSAWWESMVESTRRLWSSDLADPATVRGVAISGHSLGCVPLDRSGRLLRETTPIWSDARAVQQAERFFQRVDPNEWYRTTGNGFPPHLYTIFKILWYREHQAAIFAKIDKILGTKDYINYRLTGRIATDYSYASGTGVYDLKAWDYCDRLLAAADVPRSLLPPIVPSTEILGPLEGEPARTIGLAPGVPVCCGGVDNSCMALGARNIATGRLYASLGSSMWIAVSSTEPLLDERSKPYVFAHVIPGMFTSAAAIFSGGSTLRWVRDQLCQNLVAQAEAEGVDPYDLMTAVAASSETGAHGLLLNPSLAGGSSLDASPAIRGALLGIDLRHTQADIIRAALEGIALNLRLVLDELRRLGTVGNQMTVVGGGSRSELWRQIMADAWEIDIVKTNIGHEAGSLGAAAVAAVGCGLWRDFGRIDDLHNASSITRPNEKHAAIYRRSLKVFRQASLDQARLGDAMRQNPL